tara:strand:- start:87 stop:293 length:207 start_codon:yes stop_codon:yes gene_type:complete
VAFITGEFFGTAEGEAIPAILMKDLGDDQVLVFVLDAERGARQEPAKRRASVEDITAGDQRIFIQDAT